MWHRHFRGDNLGLEKRLGWIEHSMLENWASAWVDPMLCIKSLLVCTALKFRGRVDVHSGISHDRPSPLPYLAPNGPNYGASINKGHNFGLPILAQYVDLP